MNDLMIYELVTPGVLRSVCLSVCVCVCVCLSVRLSASISLEPLDRSSRNWLCRSPVAVARSFSGGVTIRYVLPVLWMTSRLAVMGRRAMRGSCSFSGVAIPAQSLMSMNALFRPPGPASAGRGGLYILLLYFLFLPELIDANRPIRRPPLLHQQWSPRPHS